MNIVIQCAGKKVQSSWWISEGRRVLFVADPARAPKDDGYVYARPDDQAGSGGTWREELLIHNNAPGNPLHLLPAFKLYRNPVYRRLVQRFGVEKVFILSAGWGLIRADFLTPWYNITFAGSARYGDMPHIYRDPRDGIWHDFCQLPDSEEPLVLFSGKSYTPLFNVLTRGYRGIRYVFYNSDSRPPAQGCVPVRYETRTRTNWHYECANAFIDGRIGLTGAESQVRPTDLQESDKFTDATTRFRRVSTTITRSRSGNIPKSEDFRAALAAFLSEAERTGKQYVDLHARDLHRIVGGYPGTNHRMPQCCDVLRKEMRPGDEILDSPPSGRGALLLIRYQLPRPG